jgi:hypothetical protein
MWLAIFSVVGLLKYRILDWRIWETFGLTYIGPRPQSIGLSDIGFTWNYWLLRSESTVFDYFVKEDIFLL